MAMTITATQGGVTASGILIHVFVLTGAAVSASQTGNSNSTQFSATATWTASITNSTGSNIYQAAVPGAASLTLTNSNMTLVDQVSDATHARTYVTGHVTGLASGTTTRGFTINLAETGPSVLLEILASGTIAEDASAPAVASTTAATTITTASFTPVNGSLLVALVSSNGGAGVTSMTVSGGGLTWTEKVKNNPSGGRYAGIWIADNPIPAGVTQSRAAVPVPRRYRARGVWGKPLRGPAFVAVAAPVQQFRTAPRRYPARATIAHIYGAPPFLPPLPGGWFIVRRVPVTAVWGGIAAVSNLVPVPPAGPIGGGGAGSGGDRTSALWEQLRTGCWQDPLGFRPVDPGSVPLAGASMPKLSGRGYAGPPPTRATDTDLDWSPPPGPARPQEPPAEPVGEKIREQLHQAGDGLYEIGRALARDANPAAARPCGQILQIGSSVLICQVRGKHRTHTAGRVTWK